jgi:hypothetical protein
MMCVVCPKCGIGWVVNLHNVCSRKVSGIVCSNEDCEFAVLNDHIHDCKDWHVEWSEHPSLSGHKVGTWKKDDQVTETA